MPRILYDHQIFSLQRHGGISRYFCEIASRGAEFDFSCKVVAPLYLNEYLRASNIDTLGIFLPSQQRKASAIYRRINSRLSPALLAMSRPSVTHATYYFEQRGRGDAPAVLTVFDMIHELFPQYYSKRDTTSKLKAARVKEADHIICISHSTAADMCALFDVDKRNVTVIPLGFSDAFASAAETPPSAVDRPFILYVGQRDHYKNFALVLDAYASSARLRENFDLVAFGGPPFTQSEHTAISALGSDRASVRRVEGDDRTLASFYRDARMFIYPSLYEGFGIPPLEAMAAGCPVACSSTSSLPEVVGSAALLFDPRSVEEIRLSMEQLCFDEGTRAKLTGLGFERAKLFSWQSCAEATFGVYRRLLNA